MPGFINPNKAGLSEGIFFWEGFNLPPNTPPPPLRFQEELTQCQYNFIQLLNNLFKVD